MEVEGLAAALFAGEEVGSAPVAVAAPLPAPLGVGTAESVVVVLEEGEPRAGLALADASTVRVTAVVAERELWGGGLVAALGEGMQGGGTEKPVVVQPPQGQVIGASLPSGQ